MKKIHTIPKTGHKLTINVAEFDAAQELLSRVADVLRTVRFDLSPGVLVALLNGDKPEAIKALLGQDANLVWNLFLALIASREIKEQVFVCMAKCLLEIDNKNESIVRTTFESEKARPDFLPVALEVIKANLIPFFESLASELPTREKSPASSP